MKRGPIFIGTMVILIVITVYLISKNQEVQESITYFPIDPTVEFKAANTTLTLMDQKTPGKYSLLWRTGSRLDQKAYLRQDISLLFANGRLQGRLGKWGQHTDQVLQEKTIYGNDSRRFTAVSFHHAEIHHDDKRIASSQTLTGDDIYVIASSFSPLRSFRIPRTKEEEAWKEILDKNTMQQLEYNWTKALKAYAIKKEDYLPFPLTDIIRFDKEPLPGFTQAQTSRILGNLWEGLYKNYFLGIKKKNSTAVDPIGSTIPLILIAKNQTHLLVVFTAKDGEPILLRQQLANTR